MISETAVGIWSFINFLITAISILIWPESTRSLRHRSRRGWRSSSDEHCEGEATGGDSATDRLPTAARYSLRSERPEPPSMELANRRISQPSNPQAKIFAFVFRKCFMIIFLFSVQPIKRRRETTTKSNQTFWEHLDRPMRYCFGSGAASTPVIIR